MKLPAMPVRSGHDATLNFDKIAVTVPVFVSALPFQPTDGQEVYFQNAALASQNIIWHLRYRASVGVWDFVGGTEQLSVGGDITTASVAYVDITGFTALTVPLTGLYYIDVSCVFVTAAEGNFYCVAFATAAEQGAIAVARTGGAWEILQRGRPWPASLTAGEAVKLKVHSSGPSCRYVNATLTLKPVRVG